MNIKNDFIKSHKIFDEKKTINIFFLKYKNKSLVQFQIFFLVKFIQINKK